MIKFKELKDSSLLQLTLLLSIAVATFSIFLAERYNYQQKYASVQKVSSSYVSQIRNSITHSLSATYPIAALIRTQNGATTGFSELATEMLKNYPGAAAFQLQPDGILKYVVPLAGNEGAIGHNLLLNPERTKEAFLARDTGKLTLAGPFDLVQGGVGAAARLPIYLDKPEGKEFWGFSSVLIHFPDVLNSVGLPSLSKAGIAYQLSRIHPDTGQTQVISSSDEPLIDKNQEFNIEVPNGMWSFKVAPIHGWISVERLLFEILLGLSFVGLIYFVVFFRVQLLAQYKQQVEQELNESGEKLKLSARVFSDTHEGITITDADMNIFEVNPAFCEITGYSRDEVIGKNPRILSSGKQSPEFYQAMWQQIDEKGHWQGEVWNRKKEGELYAELLTISVLKDELDKAVNYVGVFTDITISKKQQEQLSLMAHYDVLTGLPNRALFVDRFTQAIAHSKRTNYQLAVCFLDLDNFKPVNDNYGHEIGDRLLIEVAKRITAHIREEDTVSRQGGDEFALLLNDIESFAQCEQTLQRIHHALAQPFLIDDYPHKITASSGVTLYPHDEGDIDTLLRHADQAMYQAKLEGKHRYHLFNPEHDQRTIQKHHQLDEIEQALANNEFQLYYQPKVNMRTGDVYGAEALIRWIHPEKGLIPPLDFLPLIDSTDLELQLGDWVINQALQQMDSWLAQGIKLEVSVNIASHHLQSDSFFINLEAALARYPAIDSHYFQLEILESSALSDLHAISSIIKTCQDALGINIALDDFGTGYSSLTHLRNLTANTIKIDQSFVRDMLDDPDDYTIIDGVIGLADSFSRNVIAEGVETTEHGLMLLMMGCEDVQGYGISRPMPATDFPEWLSAYTPNQEWLSDGNKVRTDKEKKIRLYRLTGEYWKNTFISKVQSSPEDKQQWSVMSERHCHCGRWIKQAKKEGLFGQDSLSRLAGVHDKVHFIAQAMQHSYEAGELDKARDSLEGLVTAYNEMSNAVGLCE